MAARIAADNAEAAARMAADNTLQGNITANTNLITTLVTEDLATNNISVGSNASATTTRSTVLGVSATASAASSTAIGFDAITEGANSVALGANSRGGPAGTSATTVIGTNSIATDGGATVLGSGSTAGLDALALGHLASASFSNSVAIGANTVTLADDHIVLGDANGNLQVAGINANGMQGAVTGIVTTDAAGNLQSDGGALQLSLNNEVVNRIAADDAEALARANADTTLQANIDAEAFARNVADNAEATARIAADNTLQANIDANDTAQTNALNAEVQSRTNADTALQLNIDGNSDAIAVNSASIASNLGLINANSAAIALNSSAISELREGLAATAAIPTTGGLGADETWAIAGGLSGYDDGFGGTEVGFGAAFDFRPSTDSNFTLGLAGATSGGTYAVRAQARIGG